MKLIWVYSSDGRAQIDIALFFVGRRRWVIHVGADEHGALTTCILCAQLAEKGIVDNNPVYAAQFRVHLQAKVLRQNTTDLPFLDRFVRDALRHDAVLVCGNFAELLDEFVCFC